MGRDTKIRGVHVARPVAFEMLVTPAQANTTDGSMCMMSNPQTTAFMKYSCHVKILPHSAIKISGTLRARAHLDA